jgi:HPt (histidine-containing phosphotransfer) domain-containing protein
MKPDMFDAIRVRFIERCRGDVQRLSEFRRRSADLAGGTVDDTLLRLAHGLAGTGGTLGFPEISRQAGDLETLLIDTGGTEADRRRALDALIGSLERLIDAGPHSDNTIA